MRHFPRLHVVDGRYQVDELREELSALIAIAALGQLYGTNDLD